LLILIADLCCLCAAISYDSKLRVQAEPVTSIQFMPKGHKDTNLTFYIALKKYKVKLRNRNKKQNNKYYVRTKLKTDLKALNLHLTK